MSQLILPDEPSPPTTTEPRVLIIYGAPKVGKTSILSQLPGCLIVDLEDGTDYITALKVKVHNFAELKELSAALRAREKKYRFIAVDTVSAMEDWAEIKGTEDYKRSTIGQNFTGDSCLTLPKGAGYLWLRLAFANMINLFSGTCGNLILVAHLRDKSLEKPGMEVSAKDLELTGKIRTITCAKADAIGYVYRKPNPTTGKDDLRVSFRTLEDVICGARPAHLTGDMPMEWPLIYPVTLKPQTTT